VSAAIQYNHSFAASHTTKNTIGMTMSETNDLLEILISEVQGLREDLSKISLGDINIEDIWLRLGDIKSAIETKE
jgi:hypothetical protein